MLKKFSILACLLVFYLNSFGQLSDSIKREDNGISNIVISFEEASQDIRSIGNELLTDFQISPIETQYNDVKDQLSFYLRMGEENMAEASLSKNNDLIIIFERRLKQLRDWQESLVGFTKQLSQNKITIAEHRVKITSINTNELSGNSKLYYDKRYESIMTQMDSVDTMVENKLESVLALEYSISNDYMRTYNRIEAVKLYLAGYWKRILSKEEVAWDLSTKSLSHNSSTAENKLSDTAFRIVDFFKVNYPRTIMSLLMIFALYFFLRYVRRVDVNFEKEEQHPIIYGQPIAMSFLMIGLMFPLIFPPTTTLMYDFMLLVSYLPFLFILFNAIERAFFVKYLTFFIFFLILKIQNLLVAASGYSSIMLIICAVLFLATIVPNTIQRYFRIRWRWIRAIKWILAFVLVVGIIVVIFKRITLGRILINGAGETIALGFVFVFLGNWFDRLLEFLAKQPYFKTLSADSTRMADFWKNWKDLIYFILFFMFFIGFLKNFNLYSNAKDAFIEFFNSVRTIGKLDFTYGGIALFIIVIYLSSRLSSTIKFLTEDKSYFKSQKKTANIAAMLRFFIVTVGFLLALLFSGIPIDRIAIILGALSVGIGFGLQNIVNNLISGLILLFERPIQTGDLIEIQTYTGVVKDIGIRSSVIRTYDGAEVIVPNGTLISQEVINWTLSNKHRRVEVLVGVAYGTDATKVIELLKGIMENHDKVLKLPHPNVYFQGFGDSSINFRLLFWTSDIDNWIFTRSEITHEVYDALNNANIEIPFPQRDINVKVWEKSAIIPAEKQVGSEKNLNPKTATSTKSKSSSQAKTSKQSKKVDRPKTDSTDDPK